MYYPDVLFLLATKMAALASPSRAKASDLADIVVLMDEAEIYTAGELGRVTEDAYGPALPAWRTRRAAEAAVSMYARKVGMDN